MRLLPEKSTIVVVGAFNPALLNPAWVAKNALGIVDDRQVQIEMLTPVSVGVGTMPTRYSFEGISYSVSSQRLTMHLEGLDAPGAAKVVKVVRAIFELLPHTPVAGLGFNFGFSSEQLSRKLTNLLSSEATLLENLEEDSAIVVRTWGNTVRVGDELLAVVCSYDSTTVSVGVNAHRNLTDAADLVAALADDETFSTHLAQARAIAALLNQEEIEP